MRHNFGSTNRRTGRMEFATERVVIAVFAMVRLRMRVRGCAHILKIRLRQRRLVSRERMLGSATTAKENNRDEGRENG